MKEAQVILNRLLDKFENSKHLSEPNTSRRRVMLRIDKRELPEYQYEDAAVRDAYNIAARELEQQALVRLECAGTSAPAVGCSEHKNSAEVNGVLTPAPCSQLSRIFNCSSSNCSKVYSRFSASTSSFLERRGGRPSAFRSFALRSALPGLPESPHS